MVKKWGFSQKGEIYVKKIKDLSNFNFRIRDCICGFMRLYGYNCIHDIKCISSCGVRPSFVLNLA